MGIGERIKERRIELNLSVDYIAEKLGKNRATIYRYESNEIENLPITILEPLSKILKTTPAYLMGWENNINQESEKKEIIIDKEQKKVFAKNIKYYMNINNKDRNQVCKDLGFKYSTFTDWVNGNKYPRIDRIELMANYFGITKSDLIEEKKDYSELNQKDKKEIDDYIDDMREELLQSQTLLFDGQPADEEDIEAILNAMRIGAELVKKKNKEKYTPKKYKNKKG